jgi:hypothetical protein
MAEITTSIEDLVVIKGILLQYREEGVENPLLPLDVDIDGDGIADAYGLDENDEVILVSGCKLEDTVYVSDGDDVRDHPDEG